MSKIIRYYFLLFIFWNIIFLLNRIIFLVGVNQFLQQSEFSSILHSLVSGFWLDVSAIAYLTAIPVLLTKLYFISRKKIFVTLCNSFLIAVVILYCLISFGELFLYQELKTKLNVQALEHFRHPAEVFRTASALVAFLFFFLVIGFTFLYIFFYRKIFSLKRDENNSVRLSNRILQGTFSLFVFLSLTAIAMRGGLQAIPISESDAFFTDDIVLNDAAVNPLWSFADNFLEYKKHSSDNVFKVMPDEKANALLKEMFEVKNDTTEIFLTTNRPNIVFIILESWTDYAIKSFGGDNFAPSLDSILQLGISFTNFYASGYVSDQGIPAILSGYPATARMAIINQTSKSIALPCINLDLKKYNYQSGFYFGGDLNYGNIKSYLFNKKFDVIKDENDFPKNLPHGRLGIHDEFMAHEFVRGLNSASAPFVYSWFTLSSHSPYDMPVKIKPLTAINNDYINSVSYTDNALKKFFEEAKLQPWYNNTLFVIVADHSHSNQHDISFEDKEYHRIPLIFFGDVIKSEYHGRKMESVFSQLDITPTILKQIGETTIQYPWSKNMFNPYSSHFAFFCYHYGGGFVTDDGFVSFKKGENVLAGKKTNSALQEKKMTDYGKAFQQAVFEDFMKR